MSDGVIDETVRAVRKFLKKPDGSTPQSNQIADFLGWSFRLPAIVDETVRAVKKIIGELSCEKQSSKLFSWKVPRK